MILHDGDFVYDISMYTGSRLELITLVEQIGIMVKNACSEIRII